MADTVLTELKIHEFDSVEQMSQYESEIGENDIVYTPDVSVRLPILTPMWFDHQVNDESWLNADTFSWQSGDVYKAVYEHLAGELMLNVQLYAWLGAKDNTLYTYSETPKVGDPIVDGDGVQKGTIISVDGTSLTTTITNSNPFDRYTTSDFELDLSKTETIGDITITYYQAKDGHRICLPDQESNLVALYEATGVAWYYILDTDNQQFKLPRTKWGFTGLRDSVGGYVEAGLPNITGYIGSNVMVGSNATGAFKATNTVSSSAYDSSNHSKTSSDASFDASRSNALYGNSDTVQPQATQMRLYFWVGTFDQTATEQTAGLNAEMFNNKADTDLGNIPTNYDYVIESQLPTADNGYTWYRKYKSGWVEQGGYLSGNWTGAKTFNLPVAMSNASYTVTNTVGCPNISGMNGLNWLTGRTTTSITFTSRSLAGNFETNRFSWQVSGMAA